MLTYMENTTMMNESEVQRVRMLAKQAYEQGGQTAYVAVVCHINGEHFAYLGGDEQACSAIPAFSSDWFRFARPCHATRL